jgi:outer membrane cobalamin receptor
VRFYKLVLLSCSLLTSAFAADVTLKVVDPTSAPVLGAQVELLRSGSSTPIAVTYTSAEGKVIFRGVSGADFQARILAAGFSPQSIPLDEEHSSQVVTLKVTPAAETVVVSATRVPVPNETSGAGVSTLDAQQVETINPVAASDALRVLPGAIVSTTGQRGGLASLFVRGGDSRYNKVIVDGVTVDEPGGRFNFGVVPLEQTDRLEFIRGAQSTLYGSDAMSSVVQVWTKSGTTRTPELTFGADGGNYSTANGYANLAGARGPFDYNAFADQFYTDNQGVNNQYSNSLQGANVGYQFAPNVGLRVRVRHDNSNTGVQGEYDFNNAVLIPPDIDQHAYQNDFLASVQLTISGPSRLQSSITGFEYNHRDRNVDSLQEPGRTSPVFGNFDFPFDDTTHINRAGFEYQGTYVERSWTQTTFGYRFEDENGFVGDQDSPPISHGLRLNQDFYGQQFLSWKRLSVVAGARFVHIGTFGNRGVPRVALGFQALKGGDILSGTRLRFTYSTGIKEPLLEETFATGPFTLPNPNLKPETNRSFEAGLQQSFFGGKYALNATYFNNLFSDQVEFSSDPTTFVGQYVNLNQSLAHGAEVVFQGQIRPRLSLEGAYTYTSTQILSAPQAFDPLLAAGQPFLRRPKNSGTLLVTYTGQRWGANLGGSFVGRRPDSDFLGFGIDHAAGYALVNLGGYYKLTSRITAYANLENVLNQSYNEVVGYPALGANIRAGMRFRIGGE